MTATTGGLLFSAHINVPLRPKGRPRRGFGGRFYTPKATRDCEYAIATALHQAYRGAPIAERVRVVIACARGRGDIDNRLKLALDAANGVLWVDDRQVDGAKIDVDETMKAGFQIEVYRAR